MKHGAIHVQDNTYWCEFCYQWVSKLEWVYHEKPHKILYSGQRPLTQSSFDFNRQAYWCENCSSWVPKEYWPEHIIRDRQIREQQKISSVQNTLNERELTRGSFEFNATTAQHIKLIFREGKKWDSLSFQMRESLEQIATKIARILNSSGIQVDDWHDIAGYATLVEQSLTQAKTIKEVAGEEEYQRAKKYASEQLQMSINKEKKKEERKK